MSYCSKCGASLADDAKYCTACGEIAEPPAPQPDKNKIAELISAFTGNLFITICLLTILATAFSFNLVNILFTVFCCIIYFNAKNNKLNVPMMRAVSGTVFVNRVFCFIGAISLLVAAALIFILAFALPPEIAGDITDLCTKLMAGLTQSNLPRFVIGIIEKLFAYGIKEMLCGIAGWIATLGVYLLTLGLLWGGIHKFTKELYTKAETGDFALENAEKGASSMMAVGVITAVFAIFEFTISFNSTVPSLLIAAAMISGSMFVKKNFRQ